jgi:RNA polymerase-interacting CarD/CdnL/TRCF family regulator
MARDEVRLRTEKERDTAEKVFAILRNAFKGQRTSVKKLGDFYTRSQRQGETLQEYSLALMALRSAANKAGEEAISEKLLCQQFLEGMADEGLSRELSRLLDQDKEMTWDKLRQQSLKWSRRTDTPRRAGAVREVGGASRNGGRR